MMKKLSLAIFAMMLGFGSVAFAETCDCAKTKKECTCKECKCEKCNIKHEKK